MFIETLLRFVLLGYFVCETYCEVCYVCETTQEERNCQTVVECQTNVGCFSQTWVTSGVRYYKKGCFDPTTSPCAVYGHVFCTLEFSATCCSGDRCNEANPFDQWRPEAPSGFRVSRLTPSSVTLDWTIQCNSVYRYRVDYSQEGEELNTLDNIEGTTVLIPNLQPGLYQFTIRSVYQGRYSELRTIHRNVPQSNETLYTYCAVTRNASWSEDNNSFLQTCQADFQRCYTALNYLKNEDQPYITRGCVSVEGCTVITNEYHQLCRPGIANAFCSFCCEGNACNNENDAILTNLTCERIDHASRINCGWPGIDADTCLSRGCCYNETDSSTYDNWCHHKRYSATVPSTPTIAPTTSSPEIFIGGVVYWVVIVIILAILIFLLILVLIGYCLLAKKRRKQSGMYEVDAVYATPSKNRNRTQSTISTTRLSNTGVSIEEAT